MSEPIKIVVTADTTQAAEALGNFVRTQGNGLQVLAGAGEKAANSLRTARESSMLLRESFGGLANTTLLLGGTRFPQLTFGVMALSEGIRTLRTAATLTETSMAAIAPVAIAVAAAIGGGIYVWNELANAQKNADEETKKQVETLDKIPGIIERIQQLTKAGLLSPAASKEFSSDLGKAWFKKKDGTLTTDSTEEQDVSDPMVQSPIGLISPGTTHKEQVDLPSATHDEVQDWITQKFPEVGKEQTKALTEFNDALADAQASLGSGAKKTAEDFDKLIEKLKTTKETAAELQSLTGGLLVGPNQLAKADAVDKQLEAARDKAATGVEEKSDEEAAAKAAEAQRRIDEARRAQWEQYAQEFQAANKQLDDQMTLDDLQAGEKRGAGFLGEYAQRLVLINTFAAEGKLTTDQYTDAMLTAEKQLLDGQKEYNQELKHTQELEAAIARAKSEYALKAIQDNPFLTAQQKTQQSVPIWQGQLAANATQEGNANATINNPSTSNNGRQQAEQKLIDLKTKDLELTKQISAAQNEGSFGQQFAQVLVQMQNFGTLAQQAAASFKSIWDTTFNSLSSGITKLIEGTTTWSKELRSIEASVLGGIINQIVQMGIKWVEQEILKRAQMMITHALSSSTRATEAAETAATGATTAAALTPAATLASVSSFGTAAVIGLSALMAVLPGLASGGPAEGGQPYIVGERGPELFVPGMDGSVIPAHVTSSLMQGTGSGAAPAVQGASKNDVFNGIYFDKAKLVEELMKSDAARKHIVDVMGQNIHKFT